MYTVIITEKNKEIAKFTMHYRIATGENFIQNGMNFRVKERLSELSNPKEEFRLERYGNSKGGYSDGFSYHDHYGMIIEKV